MADDLENRSRRFFSILVALMFIALPANTAYVYADDSPSVPVVDGLELIYISSSEAVISWEMEDGYSAVIYKEGSKHEELSEGENRFIDDDLEPEHSYSYQIALISPEGVEGERSGSLDVSTKSDEQAPVISDIEVVLDTDTPKIRFTSDETVTGGIEFSSHMLDDRELGIASDEPYQTEYEVDISGLERGHVYDFVIEACNSHECARTTERSFMFGDFETDPPVDDILCQESAIGRYAMIGGNTRPDSEVRIYRDGSKIMTREVDSNGMFVVENFPLPTDGTTDIRVEVEDISGNVNDMECQVHITPDHGRPPRIEVDDLPEYISESTLGISLTTDREVDLEISRVLSSDEEESLGEPKNLEVTGVGDDHVSLRWEEPDEGEVANYIMYRDGSPIALTDNTDYTDEDVISHYSYSYRIRPIDKFCNEGPFTSPVDAQVEAGSYFSLPPVELSDTCAGSRQTEVEERIDSSFEGTISLENGVNIITITATDDSGNVFSRDYEVEMDDEEMAIVETNLDEMDDGPIYSLHTTIRGKTSKPGDVTIIVNEGLRGEKIHETETDSSGRFSQRIMFTRNFHALVAEDEEVEDRFEAGIGFDSDTTVWPHTVKINATDRFGNVGEHGPTTINHALCGGGDARDFRIDFDSDSFMPPEILPRHLIEGIATIGFGMELEQINENDDIDVRNVRVYTADMGFIQAQNYNQDWAPERNINTNREGDYAYTQIRLNLPPGHDAMDTDKSMLDREKLLAEENKGHCLGSEMALGMESVEDPTGIGCVRLALMVDVNYNIDGEEKVQQECLDMSVQIDNRVDTRDYVPNALLKASTTAAEWLADTAAELREYTEPLVLRTTQACFGATLFDFARTMRETYSCMRAAPYAASFDMVEKDGGGYEVEIPEDADEDAEDQARHVQKCFDSMVRAEESRRLQRLTCNRVACTSVPSFEKYIADQDSELFGGIGGVSNPLDVVDDLRPSYCANFKRDHEPGIFRDDAIDSELMGAGVPDMGDGRDFGPEDRVVSIFNHPDGGSWQEQMKDEFCELEFLYEYEYHCLFRNPYKESFCVYGRNNEEHVDPGAYKDHCEDDFVISMGNVVRTLNICDRGDDEVFVLELNNDYFLIDTTDDSRFFQEERYASAKVHLLELDPRKISVTEEQRGVFKLDDIEGDISAEHREELTMSLFNRVDSNCPYEETGDICRACAQGRGDDPCCPPLPAPSSNNMPPNIARYLCEPVEGFEEDIFNPTSSFFDALTCGCFNAIDAYLHQIEQVAGLLAACFNSIKETGDGSGGMCQQAASQYICDLFYSAFDCFMTYAGSSGAGIGADIEDHDEDGGPGIMSALALAGRRTGDRISNEYGDTAMYNHLFVEKNFANSFCMFMLTGQLPDGFFEAAATAAREDVPIAPVLSCSANRRFQGYDSTTGIATYVYDVAPFVSVGSDDTDVRIELMCSSDHDSDCQALGEVRRYDVTHHFHQGRMRRGDTLNDQEFIVVNEGTDPNNGHLRYDKVRVRAIYEDSEGNTVEDSTECRIREAGGSPPGFCEFDPVDAKFYCRVAAQDGSARFVEKPEAVRDVVYLDDPQEDRMIEFGTYSVRRYSAPGDSSTPVQLRIRAESSTGEEVLWNNGRNIETISITSDSVVKFGRGADTGSYQIPKVDPARLDLESSLPSDRCIVQSSNARRVSRSCELDTSYSIHIEDDSLVAYSGRMEPKGFIEDDRERLDVDFERDEDNIIFDFGGMGEFRFKERNFPVTVLTDSPDEGYSIEFTFELLDADGGVIVYHQANRILEGRQSHTERVEVRRGVSPEDREEDDLCPAPGERWDAEDSACTCGRGGYCDSGEKCCVIHDWQDSSYDLGYCIPYDAQCDDKPPQLDEVEVRDIEREDPFYIITLDNVINEVPDLDYVEEFMVVFLTFDRYLDHDGSSPGPGDPGTDPRDDDEFDAGDEDGSAVFSRTAEEHVSGSTRSQVYNGIGIYARINEVESCHDLTITAIDKVGNENNEAFGSFVIERDDNGEYEARHEPDMSCSDLS